METRGPLRLTIPGIGAGTMSGSASHSDRRLSHRVEYEVLHKGKSSNYPLAWLIGGCLCLILLGIAALVAVALIIDRLDGAATTRYLQSLESSATEAVPAGSDQKTAESWLTSQGMSVSVWGPDLLDREAEGHGIPPEQLGSIMRGMTRQHLYYGWNEVSVYFFLDKQGKVIKHRIDRFHIGL